MKTNFGISKGIVAAGLLTVVMLFAACSKDDNNNPVNPDVAGFMAFNLVTDQPAIGISLSGNTVGALLPYMSYTGGYVSIFPGKRSTDAFAGDSRNTLASKTYTYEPNKYYSLFVVGLEGDYKNVIVNDGLDTVDAADGQSYIRYINGIAGVNTAQVNIKNDTADLFSGEADFGEVSPFMALDTGAIKINISNGNKVDTSRTMKLENRKAYTILLVGNPDGDEASDSVQIRYVENGTLTKDSTSEDLSDDTR